MVPFSFHQALLKSRVMKIRSLPSSPLAGAKRAALPTFFISTNWVQRHAGLVRQTCRLTPPYFNSGFSFLFFSVALWLCGQSAFGPTRGLKKQPDFRGFKVI